MGLDSRRPFPQTHRHYRAVVPQPRKPFIHSTVGNCPSTSESVATLQAQTEQARHTHLGSLPLPSVFDRSVSGWVSVLKSVTDRSLVAPTSCCCRRSSSSPRSAAPRQQRADPVPQRGFGFSSRSLEIRKFRPMYVDLSDARAVRLASKGDRRVTRARTRGVDRWITSVFQCLIRIAFPLLGPRPHASAAKGEGISP